MHRKVATMLATLMFLAVPAVAQAADPVPTIDFDGSGFGHGVGMSQYGAYQRALNGDSYTSILGFYYHGSTIGTLGVDVPDVPEINTNVASDITSTTLTVHPGPVAQAGGIVITRDPTVAATPTVTLFSGDKVAIVDTTPAVGQPGGCSVIVTKDGGTIDWGVGSCDVSATLTNPGGTDPTNLISATNCRRPTQCTYGYGTFLHVVDNVSGHRSQHDCYSQPCGPNNELAYAGFDLVVTTNLDEYTRGISEMPYSWNQNALRTQAVAARSYGAVAALSTNHKYAGCFCDIKNSSADQVYAGWTRSWTSGTNWEAAANATAGKVVRHNDAPDSKIVSAYYSSSNGGATESSQEKWGGYRSYLISKADGQSITGVNPLATWTETFTSDQVIDKVWSSSSSYDAYRLTSADVIARNTSGSVKTVRFTADGAELGTISKTVEWDAIDQNFGLYSWYFDINDSQVAGPPPSTVPAGATSVAMQDPRTGIWSLRAPNGTVKTFYYGDPNDEPFIGDWNGDGVETVGLYRRSVGFLFIRNSNTQGVADVDIYYGIPGDIPIAGDWNGNGVETVGVFRPSNATFYLRNTNTQGIADITRPFGDTGDQPIAGDWNGDGKDTIGVYRPSTKMVYLTDNLATGSVSVAFNYRGTASGDKVIAGDWNDDGVDTLGVYRPSDGKFYLRDTFTQTSANIIFSFGDAWMNPVAGKWGM